MDKFSVIASGCPFASMALVKLFVSPSVGERLVGNSPFAVLERHLERSHSRGASTPLCSRSGWNAGFSRFSGSYLKSGIIRLGKQAG